MEGECGIGVAQSGDPGDEDRVHQVPRPEARQASQPRAGRESGRPGSAGEATNERRVSSGSPGVGTAVPVMVAEMVRGSRSFRGTGSSRVVGSMKSRLGLVTGASRSTSIEPWDGSLKAADPSVGSCMAGTERDPGMTTLLIPTPNGPRKDCLAGGRTASTVMVRCRVAPGGHQQVHRCVPAGYGPVGRPRSVVTARRLMLGRRALSSRGVTAIRATGMARSKVIDSDWPTDWSAAVATHAVSGSASNAEIRALVRLVEQR